MSDIAISTDAELIASLLSTNANGIGISYKTAARSGVADSNLIGRIVASNNPMQILRHAVQSEGGVNFINLSLVP